jgi:hypothetical protein
VIRHFRLALWLSLATLFATGVAEADRKYFVQSYTPFLAPAGTLEFEAWAIAKSGQEGASGTAWRNRAEFEYAINDRLTGAAYLNYEQDGGEAMTFEGPSLELIYLLGERGKIPLDPALYLEVLENGDVLEIEPKLLLAHRAGALVGTVNLVGEFETHHSGDESGEWEKVFQVTGGVAREFGAAFSFGLEAFYERELAEDEGNPAALLAGPSLNFQTTKFQLALGWQPQLWGDPSSDGNLGLEHFPRSEFRLIFGTDL